MILPGFVRKLSAVFRGNVAPPLIFLSVLMGAWMGMMPGWSGLHTVLAVIVLIVNLNLGLFILSLVGDTLLRLFLPAFWSMH